MRVIQNDHHIAWTSPIWVTIGAMPPPPFQIVSVFPNPFNPSVVVRFTLPAPAITTTEVWAVDGTRVAVLARDRTYPAGDNLRTTMDSGSPYPPQTPSSTDRRLASHLADYALEAEPDDTNVRSIVQALYEERAVEETGLMGTNLFRSAAAYAKAGRPFR